jgi:transposase
MESTSTYHLPIQRFFTNNNFKVQVINPILGKNNTRNLRKTKTDIEDCYILLICSLKIRLRFILKK